MKRLLVALAVSVLLLMTAPFVSSQTPPPGPPPPGPNGPGPGPGPGPGMQPGFPPGMGMRMGPMDSVSALMIPPVLKDPRYAERAKLTEEQKSKLYPLVDKFYQDRPAQMAKIGESVRAVREALADPASDRKKLEGLTADAQKAECAVAASELDTWMEVKSILTGEQLKMLGLGLVPGPTPPPGPPPGPPPSGPPTD